MLQNNGGGLVHIGLVVAEEIYERGLNTYIPKDSYCASACSFVFFAGRQRLAVGRLGVHQISAPELTGEQAQFGVSDIVATLPKYGVSADVLGIMFSTPSSDMYFFTPQEIAKYGINRVGPTQASASGAQQGGASAPRLPWRPRRSSRHPRPPRRRSSRRPRRPARRNCPAPAGCRRPGAGRQSVPDQAARAGGAVRRAEGHQRRRADDPGGQRHQRRGHEVHARVLRGHGGLFKKKRPKSEVLADKQAYFTRWPVRRFVVDQSTLRAKCENQLCMVKGIYDYKVSSPERGKNASGTSNFTYILTCAITIASSWKTARSSAAERPALHFGEAPCMSVCARPGS